MKKMKAAASLLLALLLLFGASVTFLPALQAQAASPGTWVASWSTAGVDGTISLENYVPGFKINDFIPARSVIRVETQLSAGGTYSRYRFSNEYGTSALKIDAASVALTDTPGTARILADTATPITFNDGQLSVTVQPGETVWSDSIYFPTDPLDYISVSMFIPNTTYIKTAGLYGGRTYLKIAASKDSISAANLPMASEVNITSGTITYHTTPFLTGIDVRADFSDAYSVVFIGDSTLTNEVHHYFAQRAYTAGYSNVGFVNNSIVANRLLYDGVGLIGNLYGEAVVDRFQRDVMDVTGVRAVLVKIGLNDILHPMTESMKGVAPPATVEDIINGYEQIIAAARAKGLQVYFFTNTAWNGYERSFLGQTGDLSWTREAQNMCDRLDAWVRSTNLIDGYFDMSPLSSPVDPTSLLPAFTTDGAHLTSLGAVAMADLISPKIIGAASLQTAAAINNVDPYESVDDVIAAHNASAATSTTKNNAAAQNTTKPGNGSGNTNTNTTRPAATTNVNDWLAESVLASREEAANAANRNPNGVITSTTKAPATTQSNASSSANTTANNAAANTTAASTTKKDQTATTKAPGTTASPSAIASSVQASMEQAQAPSTTAAAAQQATEEPAGDVTYADTALMGTTAANYYSVSVDVVNGAEADTVAAQPPVVASQLSGNGTAIGIVMAIVLVGMVVAAVVITMKTKRRSDME